MFPFHRHHSSSSSSSTSHKVKTNNGNSRSRDRSYKDEDATDAYQNYYPSSPAPTTTPSTASAASRQNHSKLQQHRWDYVLDETSNVLRAKENVLLTSLRRSHTDNCTDNSLRFGTNRITNMFSSMQNLKCEQISEDATDKDVEHVRRGSHEAMPRTPVKTPDCRQTSLDVASSSKNFGLPVADADGDKTVNPSERKAVPEVAPVEVVYSNLWAHDPQPGANVVRPDLKAEGKSVVSSASPDGCAVVVVVEDDLVVEEIGTVFISEKESGYGDKEKENEINSIESNDEGKNPPKDECKREDVIVSGDVQDEDDDEDDVQQTEKVYLPRQDNSLGVSLIDQRTAIALKEVVLGSARAQFRQQWMDQRFAFSTNHRLRYGLVQSAGGPCGVLAPIQAALLRVLLFEENTCSCTDPLRPTGSEARSALISAITDVLWRAASSNQMPVIAVSSGSAILDNRSEAYRCDGLTESLSTVTFKSRATLHEGVKIHLEQFTAVGAKGCLLLVLSVVLSRGIDSVKNDMDETVPLISANGQCTLELVNLLQVGRASSNVFDNNLKIDAVCELRGIHCRADVGFLSLFEHYNACQVGTYLKTPRFPIWVVCSENHFTVLFSCRKELISDWRAEKQFKLFHYDGMARQDDEVKLTIDTTGLHLKARGEGQSTPPLELCIRTKWKDAVVDWNGRNPGV